ncbi:putative secologanin synthase [Helianthus annuus]|nr:putative secologanin synthase [Helianthus annuus]KAJ0866181.1 putative secologanin synthase [Helianthus annuus]
MEVSTVWCGLGLLVMTLVWCALRFLDWVWFKPKRTEKFLRKQGLKGSSYKFLFGDMKELVKMVKEAKSKPISLNHDIVSRVTPFEYKSVTAYGKTCFTWLGPRPVVHITEPAMIKEILANNYQFQKPRGGNPLIKLVAEGLADAECDRWSKHRKIINPAFHVEKLKHMVPAFYTCCTEMINKWEDMLRRESSCEFDIWPYLQTFSSDVISRTAFGSSFEEGKRIFEIQLEQAELVIQAIQSIYIPGSRFLPTKRNKKMKENAHEVKALIRSIIDKRVIAIKEGESNNEDLLGILLDSSYKAIKQHGNNNSGLSIDEIIEECKLFYFAGQETTGNLLVWTMVLLAQNTDWQDKARDEISLVFGEKKPDIDGLNRLKIVNMIFNEVLRLYPPVVSLLRMIHQETKVGDITLPPGSMIQLHNMLVHHDRDIWGDDVKEFKPERFYDGVSKLTKGQASYFPFGGGPRICIGLNFAMLEAKTALTMILQHFRFDISPSYSHAPHSVVTLQPQFGAHLILRKL